MAESVPLIRHRTVCEVDVPLEHLVNAGVLALRQTDDETGAITIIAFIDREDWEDMGQPAEVTVSFEPGNVLQAEEDA